MPTPTDIWNLPSGAQWLKVDLHVHTPASVDMDEKWNTATAADVVSTALDKGLDAIAITDHNTAEWCDAVRQAANGTALTVFPGVEISTPQGHILAIFDNDVEAAGIEDLLVKVGIPRNQFGSLEAATEDGIVDVSASIGKAGGVAIAAHADSNHGFLKMINVGAERQRAYVTHDLWAMELLDTSSRDEHQSGTRYPRRMTCLQSSDCWPPGANRHQLDGMASRYSFLKMDERSISGLKLALIDPTIRVRLIEDQAASPNCSILGMWVTNGFLGGQQVRFNDNVSCFIGDTGSGKSVAIELLRFGLNQQARVAKIQKEVESLLKQQLGSLGTVHILLSKGESRYLVERTWGTPAEKPLVQRIMESGSVPIEEMDIRSFFPIKCFSQSEIIEFAREPEVRLSLTDDLIDCSTERSAIEELKASLRQNAVEVSTGQEKERSIRAQLETRLSLLEAVTELDRVLTDEGIVQQRQWYREQTLLDNAKVQVAQLPNRLAVATAPLGLSISWPDDMDTLPNRDLLEKIQNAFQNWQQYVAGMKVEANSKLHELTDMLGQLRKQWEGRFEESEATYRQLLEQLDKDGVGLQVLSERRRSFQEQLSVLEERDQELHSELLPRIKGLEAEREELLTKLQNCRKAITEKREEKAKSLTNKLDHKIRLKVHARTNIEGFEKALLEIGQGSYLHGADLKSLSSQCHPIPFVKQLLAKDFESLSTQSGLESSKLSRMWDTIVDRNRLADLYELQLTDVEDVIEVQLQVAQGNYRRLEDLSHGQKCMVVLMVALAEGDFPLLVDQPEDALHAPSIEEGIVATLRSGRGSRQCVFATRNANILVSADAEQIIALEADAQKGHVAWTGSLDRVDHRRLIIYHIEGGEEAFQRRKTMYTLELSR